MKVFTALLILALSACEALGQTGFSRTGLREYSLQPHLLGSRTYDFEGGASARLDSGLGIGLGYAQHLNDYLAFGIDIAIASIDYRATVTPGGIRSEIPLPSPPLTSDQG